MEAKNAVILAVLAHPDDETFGMGGTLALYASRGASVHLVCATRGEVGEMDPKFMQGFSSVAEVREAELRCAAGQLGLEGVYFLGYRDSGMPGSADNHHPQALAAAPTEKVAAEVAHYIRKLKPNVVLTFDPIGGYRHPDHIAIQKAAVQAFSIAADPQALPGDLPAYQAQKLYFHILPRGFLKIAVRLMPLIGKDPRKFGQNQDIDLASIAEVDFPVHARINYREVAQRRDEASACHASQGGGKMGGGLSGLRRLFASQEQFMRAYPPPVPGHVERDLLEGI
jgi:LmbE family N-acetylglucosaminyl deacetylase